MLKITTRQIPTTRLKQIPPVQFLYQNTPTVGMFAPLPLNAIWKTLLGL